jgi:hypothetical protein
MKVAGVADNWTRATSIELVVTGVCAAHRNWSVGLPSSTEFCLTFASVEALKGDYELMSVTDAVGGRSQAAHHTAGEILVRAGAVPTTPLAVPTELFRDGVTSHTGPTRDVNYGRFTEVAKHTVEVGVAEDENG